MRDELPLIVDAEREVDNEDGFNWMALLSDGQLQSLIRTQSRKIALLAMNCVALVAVLGLTFTAFRTFVEPPILWMMGAFIVALLLNYGAEILMRREGARQMRAVLAGRSGAPGMTSEPGASGVAAQGAAHGAPSAPSDRKAP